MAENATKPVVVTGEDVLLVQALAGEFDYAKGTKMEGQKYRRYNFGGKVFISNDEVFYNAILNGGVSKITLDSNEEGQLSLTGYITFNQQIGLKRNQVMLDLITPDAFSTNPEALFKSLENAAPQSTTE